MTLKKLAEESRKTARKFSEQPRPSHEERIRRAFFAVYNREPTEEEVTREIELSRSLNQNHSC